MTRTFSLDFKFEGGYGVPLDPHLHQLAVEFAQQYLNAPVNFVDYRKVLVACEVDENGQPIKAVGLMCGVLKPDWPVVRFLSEDGAVSLFDRARGYLEDLGGRGTESFVFIADHEEESSRCPNWREWLKKLGLRKSQRWSVTV